MAVILAVSGGFRTTVGGLRISARSPVPIALLAILNFTIWLSQARRSNAIRSDLESVWEACERHSKFVIGFALVIAVIGGVFATRSAAGADASGYISEASSLMHGKLFHADPLADLARGRDPYLTAPLGWRPSPTAGLQSPTYPPGLPLLMAIPHAIAGVNGAAAIVIGTAAIAVIATGLVAFLLGGSSAAVIASALLAFTPVFIHQAIQPMSDVPVTAAWMVCLLLVGGGGSFDLPAAGIACALAVLIRPNLAPLAIVPLLVARHRLAFSIPVAITGVGLAFLQWVWYGSPWQSGYGPVDQLFSVANIAANASHYFSWLITTSPLLFLAIAGFWRVRSNRNTQALLAFALLVIASYLAYAVFDDWSYLRFLLPALAVLAVFTAIAFAGWIDLLPISARAPALFALILVIAASGIAVARSKDTFSLASQLERVAHVGDFVRANTDSSAVIVAGEQSGSMRYYTGRPILRWEAASPDAMTAALADLERLHRPVYIVLDAWEDPLFRDKFANLPAVALDWPAVLEAGTSHRTRLWKLGDRDRFQRGERVTTVRVP